MILTPTFSKVPIEMYGKTQNFTDKQHFYYYFQNPSENSDVDAVYRTIRFFHYKDNANIFEIHYIHFI